MLGLKEPSLILIFQLKKTNKQTNKTKTKKLEEILVSHKSSNFSDSLWQIPQMKSDWFDDTNENVPGYGNYNLVTE